MPVGVKQITVHLNMLVQEKLNNSEVDYADEILSKYFGISFEEAYPEGRKGKKRNEV